jgi:YspA, cpYpsA-related SLOG family
MAKVTVIVTGGRHYPHERSVWLALNWLLERYSFVDLHHGGCPTGADFYASTWAKSVGEEICREHVWLPDWQRYGRAAGPTRNREMLAGAIEQGLDFVMVFPGGRGTADMRRRAILSDIAILEHG